MGRDHTFFPGGILALSSQAADRILSAGNADAALLYLQLLRLGEVDRERARKALRWTEDRAYQAWDALVRMELVEPTAVVTATKAPVSDQPPEYTAADLAREMENERSAFPHLVSEVQQSLGKILSGADLKQLYLIYDHMALPAEVILILVRHCIVEYERKYGAGRRPRMSQIKKEAYRWVQAGADTAAAADAYLKGMEQLQQREDRLLPLLGIHGRTAVESERKYLRVWIDQGFTDEAVALAYERTVLRRGSMNWAYMNSILKNWHAAGLHTVEQIELGDRKPVGPRQTVVNAPAPAERPSGGEWDAMDDMEQMRRIMEAEKRKVGER